MKGLASVIAIALFTASCSGTSSDDDVTVFAAASLTEVFRDIGSAFGEVNPDIGVRFAFGPSSGLATQILEGAPVDVYASANPGWMDAVESSPVGITERSVFATNRLVVIVPVGDPGDVAGFPGMGRPGIRVALGGPNVPIGEYARTALEAAGMLDDVSRNVVSNEEDAKAIVQKVLLGEADAGIVYATDVTDMVRGDVEVYPIPDQFNVLATYPIGIVADTSRHGAALEFVRFVLSAQGRAILTEHGFGVP